MALTGVLLADFSAFKKEAADSTTALKQMESGADAAAGKLSKLGEGFNLKALIEDPLGHAKEMATGFAESLGGVGVAAVATAGGIVALGTALFELGVKSAEVISRFDDLADKTGMSVPALSRLSYAANVVGADMGQLTDVVFKLQRGIGENTEAFQKGLSQMGLTTAQLKAEGPDRYLEVISEKLKAIDDPATRAAAGTAVLGKGYRDVAAALNDLSAGYELTKDITPFTKQQAADAEAFLFQLASLKEHVLALGIAIGSGLIPPLSLMVDWLGKLRGAYDSLPAALKTVLSPANLLSAAFNEGAAAVDYFVGSAAALPIDLDKASESMRKANDVTAQLKINVPTLTDAFAAQKEVVAADAAALASWQKAVEALVGSTAGWQATLDTLDGTVAEAITFYLSAGVSQSDLAKAYGVTAEQVKAVATSLEEYSATLNATADFESAAGARRLEITRQMTAAINDQIVAELKRKQAEADANEAFLADALKEAQAQDAIQQGVTETASTTTAAAGEMGSAFEQSFAKSASAFDSFKGVVVAGTGVMAAAVGGFNAATNAGAWVQNKADMFQEQMARGIPFVVGGGGTAPMQTRDSGGPVTAGESYVIGGGKPPELFTPGASGFVTPGGKGGATVNVTIHVNGTAADVARKVAAEILRTVKQGTQLS